MSFNVRNLRAYILVQCQTPPRKAVLEASKALEILIFIRTAVHQASALVGVLGGRGLSETDAAALARFLDSEFGVASLADLAVLDEADVEKTVEATGLKKVNEPNDVAPCYYRSK